MVRHPELLREGLAPTPVPVEELDHPRRIAERLDPLGDAVTVERVDEPYPALGEEGVRAPLEELVADPAEAEVGLVAESDGLHTAGAVVRTSPLASTTPSSQRASTRPLWNCCRYSCA